MPDNGGNPANAPLFGVRVLDLTRTLAGPYATLMLGDLGAEVLRVEDLQGSDSTRHNHPFVNGESHYYLAVNRNKKGLAINLKHPEGAEIIRRLAAQSDIVLESFRPGVMERLGLSFAQLQQVNRRLVYCSLSGWGQTGERATRVAYDIVIQAATGAMDATGEPSRPPTKMGIPLADLMTGMHAAIAVVAALGRVDSGGEGCHIDMSMFDVSLSLLTYMAMTYFATSVSPRRVGSGHNAIYPYNAFSTLDGHIVVAPFTQAFWRNFCAAINRNDLPADPRFQTFADRHANREALAEIIEPIVQARSTADWMQILDEADVPNGPVNDVAQALSMDQTLARGMVAELVHPRAGRLRILGTPFRYRYSDGTRFAPSFTAAPLLGEHTAEVLTARLSYEQHRIQDLVRRGVMRGTAPIGNGEEP